MVWYALLAAVTAGLLVSLAFPTLRRMWAFNLRLGKYALLWLADRVGLRRLILRSRGRRYQRLSRPMIARLFCEDMGPTFLKLGQIIASSAGIFPDRYVREFQKVLDRVRPFSFAEVQRILREDLGEERAAQLVDIEPRPLASASIAQVHTARLDDGTSVVIKVQRPGIAQRIAADMRILRFVAGSAQKRVRDAELVNPVGIVEDFSQTLGEELDFRKEAQNLDRFNEIMAEHGRANVRAPVPHWELCTQRVLVMERFIGHRVDDVEAIRESGVDAEVALVEGLLAWFQCVVFHGFFHGDVHAGNLMLLENRDLGFLDFGIVGRFDDQQRYLVTDYIIAFATGDYRKLAQVIADMGGVDGDRDLEPFAADLKETYSPLLTLSFGEVNYADFLPKINEVARRHRMTMPKEFILITKQMLYFDRYAKLLAPKLNIFTDPRLVMSLMGDIQKVRAERDAAVSA